MSTLENLSMDKLRRLKETLKKKTIEQKIKGTGLLDKFTSIDELLIDNTTAIRQLIEEQRDTNRALNVTNKLLLALYIQEDADGNYTARLPGDIDTTGILEALEGGGEEKTHIKSLPNMTITGKKQVFAIFGNGRLIEVLFKSSASNSDNKHYSARIIADNENEYEDTFDNFTARNYFERDLTCYEDTQENKYILQIQNIGYSDSLIVEIYDSVAIFEQIYIKYQGEI